MSTFPLVPVCWFPCALGCSLSPTPDAAQTAHSHVSELRCFAVHSSPAHSRHSVPSRATRQHAHSHVCSQCRRIQTAIQSTLHGRLSHLNIPVSPHICFDNKNRTNRSFGNCGQPAWAVATLEHFRVHIPMVFYARRCAQLTLLLSDCLYV